ncbi:hypothetical protein KCP77_13345 [Salmonella enterica subsp. enterica]|nr:hypothetical protein KCP77_13345 [Salmonella enterica subsp. enterica]
MIPPEIRRSVLLQKAIKLALAGTLLTFARFRRLPHPPSPDTETPQPPDILLGPLLMRCPECKNSSPIRKPFADAIPTGSDPPAILGGLSYAAEPVRLRFASFC